MGGFEHVRDVSGVGDATIRSIREAGFESESELAALSTSELADAVDGIGRTTAHSVLYELDRRGYRVDTDLDDSLAQLRVLLGELFRIDDTDRTFGIYRLLDRRREAIEEFIDTELVGVVEDAVAEFDDERTAELKERLRAERERLGAELEDPFTATGALREEYRSSDVTERYRTVREQLERAEDARLTEADVYSDVYGFFERYYDDGDVVPIRRRGREASYAVPYDGSETYFHWANRDQFYTKTSEHYESYSFEDGGVTVVFDATPVVLDDARTSSRFYVPAAGDPVRTDAERERIRVEFEHRKLTDEDLDRFGIAARSQRKQATINDQVADRVREATADLTVAGEELAAHLDSYTSKRTGDYFVHRDLRGFLEGELDGYLQTEVLDVDPSSGVEVTRARLRRAEAVGTVAERVIDFLAGVEELQKRLYRKQRFVTASEHLIPVGRLPESTYPTLLDSDEQVATWRRDYGLDGSLDEGDLARRPTMVVDTAHFDRDTTVELLDAATGAESLAEATRGRLLKGDNYHALRLLRERYADSVSCIYVDPPYNTGDDGFLYKDDYRHSSWLSMMADRLRLAHSLLAEDGVVFVSIDENEMARLRLLMDEVFGSENLLAELVWDLNNSATQGHFYRSHEYVLAYAKDKARLPNFEFDPALEKFPAAGGELIEHNAIKRVSQKNPASEIRFPAGVEFEGEDAVFEEAIPGRERIEIVDGPLVFEDGELAEPVTLRAGWAMRDQITEWLDTGEAYDSKGQRVRRFYFNRNGKLRYEKERGTMHPRTVLESGPGDDEFSSTQAGTRELAAVLGEASVDYPKPVDLVKHLIGVNTGDGDVVMDFFAGSGTTGQAAVELNREREATVEYILVEISDLFETTVQPRIRRCYYAPEWDGGEPARDPAAHRRPGGEDGESGRDGDEPTPGDHPLVAYETLETYDESLDAVEFADGSRSLSAFEGNAVEYLLDRQTRDSPPLVDLEKFDAPFEYALDARPRGRVPVDLPATFAHLLGIAVDSVEEYEHDGVEYHVVAGTTGTRTPTGDEESVLVVWRPTGDLDQAADREFVTGTLLADRDVDVVFTNHDSAVPGARSLDRPFVARMFEGVDRGK